MYKVSESDYDLIDPFETPEYKEDMDWINAHHGFKLSTYRWNAGLTQKELAEKTGISRTNISLMENDKRPIGVAVAKKLAPVLNRNYKDLL